MAEVGSRAISSIQWLETTSAQELEAEIKNWLCAFHLWSSKTWHLVKLNSSNWFWNFSGLIPVSATTRVSGRVNVLNIYKRHAVSYSWCDMSVFIANATLASFHCRYSLHQWLQILVSTSQCSRFLDFTKFLALPSLHQWSISNRRI